MSKEEWLEEIKRADSDMFTNTRVVIILLRLIAGVLVEILFKMKG